MVIAKLTFFITWLMAYAGFEPVEQDIERPAKIQATEIYPIAPTSVHHGKKTISNGF